MARNKSLPFYLFLESASCQYLIKCNRLIVPMHTSDIVTAGFKAILGKLPFYQFLLFVLFSTTKSRALQDRYPYALRIYFSHTATLKSVG